MKMGSLKRHEKEPFYSSTTAFEDFKGVYKAEKLEL